MMTDDEEIPAYGSIQENCEKTYQEYYQRVMHFRYLQTGLLFLTFLSSAVAFLSFSYLNLSAGPYCILYSTWKTYREGNGDLILDENTSEFGTNDNCSLFTYTFAVGGMLAFILVWFTLLFQPSTRRLKERKPSHASRLVLPTTIVSGIFSASTFLGACIVSAGIDHWCRNSFELMGNECSAASDLSLHTPLRFHHVPLTIVSESCY